MDDMMKLDPIKLKWQKLKQSGDVAVQGRLGHTATAYGNNGIFIFGGEKKYNEQLKMRECLNDLRLFHIEKLEWKQLKCSGEIIEPRRHHTAFIIAKHFIIYGGINSRGNTLKNVWSLNLLQFKWSQLHIENHQTEQIDGIAYHKCALVFHPNRKFFNLNRYMELKADMQLIDFKVKQEGVYFFGGINSQGDCLNDLKILQFGEGPIKWINPETIGTPPTPRYGHTINFFDLKKLLIIYGGRNDKLYNVKGEAYLNDINILNLQNMNWCSVSIHGLPNQPRAFHCSVIIDTRLLIFGDVNMSGFLSADVNILEIDQVNVEQYQAHDDLRKSQIINNQTTNQPNLDISEEQDDYKQKIKQKSRRTKKLVDQIYNNNFVSYQPVPKIDDKLIKKNIIDFQQEDAGLKNRIKRLVFGQKLNVQTDIDKIYQQDTGYIEGESPAVFFQDKKL